MRRALLRPGKHRLGRRLAHHTLYLRWQATGDAAIPPLMGALLGTAPSYPSPCDLPSCHSWSDVPEWDAIAAMREYEVLGHDPQALAKAEAAFAYVEGGDAFALGACPEIRYQQASGEVNHLKTLETDANAIKAAILLYQATGDRAYLDSARRHYAAVRARFLDPVVPLYTVYVFDDGADLHTGAPPLLRLGERRHDLERPRALAADRHAAPTSNEAIATARAVGLDLSDSAGVFADLQAENDIVEPLVEAMYALATEAAHGVRPDWILTNAAAALSARAPDGAFGRFFDGPPPRTTVTAWQMNGGLSLEIAAAALDPDGTVPSRPGGPTRAGWPARSAHRAR